MYSFLEITRSQLVWHLCKCFDLTPFYKSCLPSSRSLLKLNKLSKLNCWFNTLSSLYSLLLLRNQFEKRWHHLPTLSRTHQHSPSFSLLPSHIHWGIGWIHLYTFSAKIKQMYPNFVFDFSCSTLPLPYFCFTPALPLLYSCFTPALAVNSTVRYALPRLKFLATASSLPAY